MRPTSTRSQSSRWCASEFCGGGLISRARANDTDRVGLATAKKGGSLARLRALRRRSERNNGFAIETGKRVEPCTIFVRLAAQHCQPAERAMPKGRSRLSGHWGDVLGSCGGYLLSPRVCRSAQYSVAAKMPKAVATSATQTMSIELTPLVHGEHDVSRPSLRF